MRFFMVLSEYCSMLLPVLACFLLVGGIAVIVYLKKISEAFFCRYTLNSKQLKGNSPKKRSELTA